MNKILIILILLIPFNGYSQLDTCLRKQVIINAAIEISTLRQTNDILTRKVDNLQFQVGSLELTNKNQSLMLSKKDEQMEIMYNMTKKFADLTTPAKTPWYKSPEINFIGGVVVGGTIVYVGAVILSLINVGGG